MAKTTKGAAKTAAKIARGKAKVARKCGKAAKAVAVALFASALFAAGCMGTTTPSRSQTLCIKDCTISVYGCGTETNEVPRIELATQAMSIEKSFLTRSFLPAPVLYPTIGMHPAAIPMTIDITIWKNFMTMPTTAIGIWAYSVRPNIGSRAPYLRIILFIAAIAATRDI